MAEAGTVIAGRYRLERLIGMGAMGQVFEAWDLDLETTVAAKLLGPDLVSDSTALQRFRQELLLARKISHPNVIRLHDMVHEGSWWLITMDFVAGRTLADHLREIRSAPVEQAIDYAMQIARGLEAAHDVGVVHRDLKPANILIDSRERLLISDFGIARSLSQAGLTRQGVIVGTLDYLSPEQAAGEKVDGRSDLYALGIILCEMLTGGLPFFATTAEEAISQRLVSSPRPLQNLDDCPHWLAGVCHRLLRRDPDERYQSARAVIEALRQEQAPRGRRFKAGVAIASALVVALGAAATWSVWRNAPESESPAASSAAAVEYYVLPPLQTEEPEVSWAIAGVVADALAPWREAVIQPVSRTRSTWERLMIPTADMATQEAAIADAYAGGRRLSVDYDDKGLHLRGAAELEFLPLLAEGELGAALVTLRAKIGALPFGEMQPELPDALPALTEFYRGRFLMERGETLAAIAPLTNAADLDPESAAVWWALAMSFKAQGRVDEALDASLRAGRLAGNAGLYAGWIGALQAETSGQPTQAAELLQAHVERYPSSVLTHLWLAELHAGNGDIEQAIALCREALNSDPDRTMAWYQLGKYSILTGQAQRALDDYLTQGLVRSKRQSSRQAEADLVNAMGVAYDQLGQLDEAAENYGRAERMRAEIGDARGQASTLRNLAAIASFSGAADDAARYLARARTILEELGDQSALADLFNDEGILAEENGRYDVALEKYRNALRIRQQLPDDRKRAESLSNVGYAFYQTAEYGNAEAYWQQALDQYEQLGIAVGRVHVLQQLALLQWVEGDWSAAIDLLRQSEHLSISLQMHEEQAVNHGLLAQVFYARGDFSEALGHAETAEQGFSERSDVRGLTEMTLLKAQISLARGDVEPALSQLESLELEPLNVEQQAKVADTLARSAFAAGRLQEAIDFSENAISLAQASGSAVVLAAAQATRLLVRPGTTTSDWDTQLEKAADIGHVPLIVDTLSTAIQGVASDVESLARWSVTYWPILSREQGFWQRNSLLERILPLCPLGTVSCDDLNALRAQGSSA